MSRVIWLSTRRLIRVGGVEAKPFLQGLLTNDINLVKPNSAFYSFILNVKGRVVHDLLVYNPNCNEYWLEVDRHSFAGLERMLKVYRLRRKVEIEPLKSTGVGFSVSEQENSIPDPRVSEFGFRVIGEVADKHQTAEDEYLERRLEWGIAEGQEELFDQIPLNANGDLLNGISFDKGCYVGQELIARTHHTGVVRRRIVPFKCEHQANGFIVDSNGKKQGRVLKSSNTSGIGLMALSSIGSQLFVNDEPIQAFRPKWWPEEVR
ncbi:hypothetical protein M3Y94_00757700 [Aphelenchoides besseyi]|nr:hypothetical protein M3Y94_00757700 [Aphelenchoides besseyi]KAI6232136.1 putative transferase CAF17, mitochondrial [Aphelenchoides besseyi]